MFLVMYIVAAYPYLRKLISPILPKIQEELITETAPLIRTPFGILNFFYCQGKGKFFVRGNSINIPVCILLQVGDGLGRKFCGQINLRYRCRNVCHTWCKCKYDNTCRHSCPQMCDCIRTLYRGRFLCNPGPCLPWFDHHSCSMHDGCFLCSSCR